MPEMNWRRFWQGFPMQQNLSNWGSSNGILVHENGERIATYPILSPPGNSRMITPLQFSFPALLASYILWLLLIIAVGYLASRSCAKHAANLSIRRSLEHF